jgi:hypothetical protein
MNRTVLAAVCLLSSLAVPDAVAGEFSQGDRLFVKEDAPVQKGLTELGKLPRGTMVEAQEVRKTDTGVWIKVNFKGVSPGWVSTEYLESWFLPRDVELDSAQGRTFVYWNTACTIVESMFDVPAAKRPKFAFDLPPGHPREIPSKEFAKRVQQLRDLPPRKVDAEAIDGVLKMIKTLQSAEIYFQHAESGAQTAQAVVDALGSNPGVGPERVMKSTAEIAEKFQDATTQLSLIRSKLADKFPNLVFSKPRLY